MLNRKFWPSFLFVVIAGGGCPIKEVSEEPTTADAGVDDGDGRDMRPKLPPPQGRDLGAACGSSGDCASGFCVDSVCCDGPCDQQCFGCATPGAAGHCTALDGVEDLSAPNTCTGATICAKDSSGTTACRLKDGQACTQPADCASGYCRSYFRDQDHDGYGADTPDTIIRCDTTPAPPQGFTSTPGDCCDSDPGAHPGISAYFTAKDACGSFDWNCSGAEDKQSSGTCPTTSGTAPGCGQACTLVFKGTTSVLFVQACH